ncbi:MAG: FtsQ-type POTRA domain-containing protein [Actinomycetota bacterium]|nr:FtsQ-type POTRA domain-containing protein [Actinomycetota bacterium]
MAATRKHRPRSRAAIIPFPSARGGRAKAAAYLPSGRSIAIGLALLAGAAGAYAAARTTSLFAIETVRVEGTTPAVAQLVQKELESLRGTSLLAVDGGEVVRRVEALPDVRSASLDRAFPHALVVDVRRELPAAVLRAGEESWLLSERGRVLRRVARGMHPRLPRIWSPERVELGALVSDAHAVLAVRAVRQLRHGFPARIRTASAGNEGLVLQLASGLDLRLGDPDDLALKLAVASQLLRLVEPPTDYLDVSIPERPVAGENPQVEG